MHRVLFQCRGDYSQELMCDACLWAIQASLLEYVQIYFFKAVTVVIW